MLRGVVTKQVSVQDCETAATASVINKMSRNNNYTAKGGHASSRVLGLMRSLLLK